MPSGLRKVKRHVTWTPEIDSYLIENYPIKFLKIIAEEMDLVESQVYSRMERLGLSKGRRTVKRQHLKAIEKWTTEESAYFAGIVDGEGTISCQVTTGKSGNLHLRPNIVITNTSLALMQYMESIGMTATIKKNTNNKLYWLGWTSGFQCQDLIVKIRPFLRIKHRHADILTEIISIRYQQKLSDLPTQHIMDLLAELKDLNRRGSSLLDDLKRADLLLTSLRPNSVLSRELL